MLRQLRARAGKSVLALMALASACNLVGGLNRLQEVDCVGTCQPDASGPTADAGGDAASIDDATAPPTDASAPDGADGAYPSGNDASADASPDAGDGGDASLSLLYLGCFADSTTRDLPVSAYYNSMNTPDLCITVCGDAGYAFAGLQNTVECRCGNAFGGQGPSGGCTEPCTADDASAICGGNYANSIYATSSGAVPPPPKYLGCFLDGNPRDLPDQTYGNQYGTIFSCAAACAYHGYLYAGAQNSTYCYCGDSYGTYGTSLGCIDPCAGDAAETCGGYGVNSVYRTSVTDASAGNADGG